MFRKSGHVSILNNNNMQDNDYNNDDACLEKVVTFVHYIMIMKCYTYQDAYTLQKNMKMNSLLLV